LLGLQRSWAVRPLSHTVSAVVTTGEKTAGTTVAIDAMIAGTVAKTGAHDPPRARLLDSSWRQGSIQAALCCPA
jgi:hypothetical protein